MVKIKTYVLIIIIIINILMLIIIIKNYSALAIKESFNADFLSVNSDDSNYALPLTDIDIPNNNIIITEDNVKYETPYINKYERNYILRQWSIGIADNDFDAIDATTYSNFDFYSVPIPTENSKYRYPHLIFSQLYRSLVDFHTKPVQEFVIFMDAIHQLATNKYLSVLATFDSIPTGYQVRTCVTIDLEQGKEVFLKDLIDVNDDFIRLLLESNIAKTDEVSDLIYEFGHPSDFSQYTFEEVRQKLNDCSKPTPRDDNFDGYYDSLEQFYKPSFFLAPNQICFINFNRSYEVFYIRLDDIEEFLKVEKW